MELKGLLDGHALQHVFLDFVVSRGYFRQQLQHLCHLVLGNDDDAIRGVVEGNVARVDNGAIDFNWNLQCPWNAPAARADGRGALGPYLFGHVGG